MKKIIIYFSIFILYSCKSFSQVPITNTVSAATKDYLSKSVFPGMYIKDINGDFNPYLGNWKWTNGSDEIVFIIKKITQQYLPECFCYSDFLVSDYKYTTNNGNTTIVNTIPITNNSVDFNNYKMICPRPKTNIMDFVFRDVLHNKSGSIIFTRVSGTTNQMTYQLENPEITGTLTGEPDFNPNFSIPNNITVTKQP